MPNLLLIAGNGRNVGKTHLACKIIKHFSPYEEVTGLKISSHFHPIEKENIILENENFIIAEERNNGTKDSSLMLLAGAKKVYFVMSKRDYLKDAFNELFHLLPENLIVCESGGLHEFVKPGLFLFVKRADEKIVKKHLLEYAPIIVNNDGKNFDFNIQQIEFIKNKFRIHKNLNEQI